MSITKDQNDKMSTNVIGELKELIKEYNKEIILLKQQLKRK